MENKLGTKQTRLSKETSEKIERLFRDGNSMREIKDKLLADKDTHDFDGLYCRIYYVCKKYGENPIRVDENENAILGYKGV